MFGLDKKQSYKLRQTSDTDHHNNDDVNNSDSKSSYYVWFLGSRESKGLRGAEYVRPVVKSLLQNSKSHHHSDSVKLTLQVNARGVKIVHTPSSSSATPSSDKHRKTRSPSNVGDLSTHKQFIPHSSVTCVVQGEAPNDDVVSCIYLMSSLADCPLYVHAYRCDAPDTAEVLKQQLQAFVDRPENRAKYDEIERRLVEKGLLPKFHRVGSVGNASSKMGSDGRSLGRSSDSGGSDLNPTISAHPALPAAGGGDAKLVSLHDSLAAELREKLSKKKAAAAGPLLLPPKDYDTMHRGRGNVMKKTANNSSSNNASSADNSSSGIGSDDHGVSPMRDDEDEDDEEHKRSSGKRVRFFIIVKYGFEQERPFDGWE